MMGKRESKRLPHRLLQQTAVHDLKDERRPRELTPAQYLAENPKGNRCSRCGITVPASPDVEACLCWRCLHLLAQLREAGYWGIRKAKVCAECGRPRPKGKTYCPGCAKRKRRVTYRKTKRRQRKDQKSDLSNKIEKEAHTNQAGDKDLEDPDSEGPTSGPTS